MEKMNIGISEKERENITEGLSRLLADSYLLYLKTHNFHWNVTGPQFECKPPQMPIYKFDFAWYMLLMPRALRRVNNDIGVNKLG